jgi:hypothetical protein
LSLLDRADAERQIGQVLLEQWDPLGVHDKAGPHEEYTPYIHDVYGLLARGASDVQLARHLHRIEREEMNLPELAMQDLTPVVRALRNCEKAT